MPRMNNPGRGDAYVKVNISVPRKTSKKQKELIEQLAKQGL
jgi:DnaJ-class molecular chaperone